MLSVEQTSDGRFVVSDLGETCGWLFRVSGIDNLDPGSPPRKSARSRTGPVSNSGMAPCAMNAKAAPTFQWVSTWSLQAALQMAGAATTPQKPRRAPAIEIGLTSGSRRKSLKVASRRQSSSAAHAAGGRSTTGQRWTGTTRSRCGSIAQRSSERACCAVSHLHDLCRHHAFHERRSVRAEDLNPRWRGLTVAG